MLKAILIALTLIGVATPPEAMAACGLLGCILKAIPLPGAKQLGQSLDDANRQLKQTIRPYGQTEDAISGGVQHGLNELNGETVGPALAQWIIVSRNNVFSSGVNPLPPQIYNGLLGYFSPDVLNSVKYRSGWGNELALPAMVFRFGDRAAITLGPDVIMFRDESDAQNNLSIWAHELTHVIQYRRWGILDFAKRYVKDWNGVEQEAIDNASRFDVWYSQGTQFGVRRSPFIPLPGPSAGLTQGNAAPNLQMSSLSDDLNEHQILERVDLYVSGRFIGQLSIGGSKMSDVLQIPTTGQIESYELRGIESSETGSGITRRKILGSGSIDLTRPRKFDLFQKTTNDNELTLELREHSTSANSVSSSLSDDLAYNQSSESIDVFISGNFVGKLSIGSSKTKAAIQIPVTGRVERYTLRGVEVSEQETGETMRRNVIGEGLIDLSEQTRFELQQNGEENSRLVVKIVAASQSSTPESASIIRDELGPNQRFEWVDFYISGSRVGQLVVDTSNPTAEIQLPKTGHIERYSLRGVSAFSGGSGNPAREIFGSGSIDLTRQRTYGLTQSGDVDGRLHVRIEEIR